MWFGSGLGPWMGMWGAPHSSSELPGENLLNRTLLKDFRERHNSDDSLLVISQPVIIGDCSSGQRMFAGTALSRATEPHLTLTHDWMWSQGLIVLVICNLPLPAKYFKPSWKGYKSIPACFLTMPWNTSETIANTHSWILLPPWVLSCLFWWPSSPLTVDLCIKPNAEAGRLCFVDSQ